MHLLAGFALGWSAFRRAQHTVRNRLHNAAVRVGSWRIKSSMGAGCRKHYLAQPLLSATLLRAPVRCTRKRVGVRDAAARLCVGWGGTCTQTRHHAHANLLRLGRGASLRVYMTQDASRTYASLACAMLAAVHYKGVCVCVCVCRSQRARLCSKGSTVRAVRVAARPPPARRAHRQSARRSVQARAALSSSTCR